MTGGDRFEWREVREGRAGTRLRKPAVACL